MDKETRATKILVIDDDPDSRSRLRMKLQRICCDVIMAENDLEGLQLGFMIQPDLILLDAKIKQMGGVALCERLKRNSHTRDIPIIFLVAQGEVEDIVVGLEIGAADYVVFPYALNELKIRILKTLTLHAEAPRNREVFCHSEAQLATQVADELCGTLRMIRGFAKPLMKRLSGLDEPISRSYLEGIMALTDFGRELANDYQLLSHATPLMENVDPIQIAASAIQIHHQAIDEKNQSIRLKHPQEEKPVVKGNARKLLTAVSHLIFNAHKMTERGGSITVAILWVDKGVRIEVSNTGIGIPPHRQGAILGHPLMDHGRGRGNRSGVDLGLTIAKSVAEQHYGHLGIERLPGQGNRVWIDLPSFFDSKDYIHSQFSMAL